MTAAATDTIRRMKDKAAPVRPAVTTIIGKAPAMNCPVCGSRGNCRSSEEETPEFRRLYYRCPNIICGMTWTATLAFERTISPSGLSAEFRAPKPEHKPAPGHDFGQMTIFDLMPPTLPG